MTPQTVLLYEAAALRQAWCAEAMTHGTVRQVARQVGVAESTVYHLLERQRHLPQPIMEALGVLPVRSQDWLVVVGYVTPTPLDLTLPWKH